MVMLRKDRSGMDRSEHTWWTRHASLLRKTTSLLIGAGLSISYIPGSPAQANSPNDGRYVAYGAHIDSPQSIWNADTGTFELKTKLGELKDPDDVVNWVPKGWSTWDGHSQYQFTVPDKPGLEFLSAPGTTWYEAPALPEGNHLPTWIGFGAGSGIPAEKFRDASFSLDLIDINGPGRFEMFNAWEENGKIVTRRLLSSSDPGLRSAKLTVGAHTHNKTLFSVPGTYDITYRTVARDKETGKEISSKETVFHWQVGGTQPADHITQTLEEEYAQAPEGLPTSTYTFTAKPYEPSGTVYDGDRLLTDFIFDAGDPSVNGTATILLNGYHLADIPVREGTGGWLENIGITASDFQVVFIPDSGAGKWISPPLHYGPHDPPASVTSDTSAETIMEKMNHPQNTRLDTSDIVLDDLGYDVDVRSNGDGTATVRVEMHDKDFRGYVDGALVESLENPYFDSVLEGNFRNGVWETTKAESEIRSSDGYYYPTVRVIPHPQVRAGASELIINERYSPDRPLHASGSLRDTLNAVEASPHPQPPENSPPTPPESPSVSSPSSASPTTTPSENPATPGEGEHMTSDNRILLDTGHVDLLIRRESSGFTFALKDDTGIAASKSVIRDLDDVALGVKNKALGRRTENLAGSDYDYLGKVGDTFYSLPIVQDQNLLWPGYNTQELDFKRLAGSVTLQLTDIKKPEGAHFAMATQQGGLIAKPQVLLNTRTGDTSFPIAYATHAHTQWVFSEKGQYDLTFTATAKDKDGEEITSKPVTMRYYVGSEAIAEAVADDPTPSDTPSVATVSPSPTTSGSASAVPDVTNKPSTTPSSATSPSPATPSTAPGYAPPGRKTPRGESPGHTSPSHKPSEKGTSGAGGTGSGSGKPQVSPLAGGSGSGGSNGEGGSGASGSGTDSSGTESASSHGSGDAGSLPRTGGDLIGLFLGLPLVLAGAILVLAARRKRY